MREVPRGETECERRRCVEVCGGVWRGSGEKTGILWRILLTGTYGSFGKVKVSLLTALKCHTFNFSVLHRYVRGRLGVNEKRNC